MDPGHLSELISVERNYWWHIAKRELVTDLLQRHFPAPGRLVEGGIGAGGNLVTFQRLGYQVAGFDVMPEAVDHCKHLGVDDVHTHDLQEPWPLEPASAKAVILLDVLEHTPEPVRVLRHAARVLEPGGGLVVTVPAYPWLMGPWDRMLGHHRRYTARLLKEQAREAGLRVAWLSHWNAFTLPAAVAVRSLERFLARKRSSEFPSVSPRVNALLLECARWERRWMHNGSVPLGLSLVGVFVP